MSSVNHLNPALKREWNDSTDSVADTGKKQKQESLIEKLSTLFASLQVTDPGLYEHQGRKHLDEFLRRKNGGSQANSAHETIKGIPNFAYSGQLSIQRKTNHFVVNKDFKGFFLAGLLIEELHKNILLCKKGMKHFLPLQKVDDQMAVAIISKELSNLLPQLFQPANSQNRANVGIGSVWISTYRNKRHWALIEFRRFGKKLEPGDGLFIEKDALHIPPDASHVPQEITDTLSEDPENSSTASLDAFPHWPYVASEINRIFLENLKTTAQIFERTNLSSLKTIIGSMKFKYKKEHRKQALGITDPNFYSSGTLIRNESGTGLLFKKAISKQSEMLLTQIENREALLRRDQIETEGWYFPVNAGKEGHFFVRVSNEFHALFLETAKNEANTNLSSLAIRDSDEIVLAARNISLVAKNSPVTIEQGQFFHFHNLPNEAPDEEKSSADLVQEEENSSEPLQNLQTGPNRDLRENSQDDEDRFNLALSMDTSFSFSGPDPSLLENP